MQTSISPLRVVQLLKLTTALVALSLVWPAVPPGSLPGVGTAQAHTTNDWVSTFNPVMSGARWPWGGEVAPAGHHIVYSNYGYKNDFSMDVFAGASGKRVVTPFGTKTNTGHLVESRVVAVGAGCGSRNLADGGYRVTIEARDKATGVVLGRADVMHVDRVQVGTGAVLGAWTTIGYTSRFRSNGCYQVGTDAGIHVHLEFANAHRYACWLPYAYNAALGDLSKIGIVGAHYGGQRARC